MDRYENLIKNGIQPAQESYVEGWLEESEVWHAREVYHRAAEFIGLKKQGFHLEIGVGLGHLLGILKQQTPNSIIVGVDRNEVMLHAASLLLDGNNVRFGAYSKSTFESISENQIVKKFLIDAELLKETNVLPLRPSDRVHLIGDDIRTATILRFIIGNRKIDSVSFIMPGTGSDSAIDSGAPLEKVGEEGGFEKYSAQVIKETRKATYQFVSKYVKAGGVFVMAERMHGSEAGLAGKTRQLINELLGKCSIYWEQESSTFLRKGLEDVNSPIGWSANGKEINPQQKQDGGVLVQKLVRNHKKFGKKSPQIQKKKKRPSKRKRNRKRK